MIKHIKGIMAKKGYYFLGTTVYERTPEAKELIDGPIKMLTFSNSNNDIIRISRKPILITYKGIDYLVTATKDVTIKKKEGRHLHVMKGKWINIKNINQLHNILF